MSLDWDCDVMSRCGVTAGELAWLSEPLWSPSLARHFSPAPAAWATPAERAAAAQQGSPCLRGQGGQGRWNILLQYWQPVQWLVFV